MSEESRNLSEQTNSNSIPDSVAKRVPQDLHDLTREALAGFTKQRTLKYMFLRVGSSHFAIPLSSVREVLGLSQMTSLPNMPSYFAGLINLRGKIVSAVDLKKSLSFVSEKQKLEGIKRPCIVITEFQGRLFGAIVDDVVEVTAVPEHCVDHAVDGIAHKESFCGVIKRPDHPLAPILKLDHALRLHELLQIQQGLAG